MGEQFSSVGAEFYCLLGRRLRDRRRLMGMTQQELGSACGVRFQQIQKYETAVNRVTAEMLWKLANALSVDANYFFPPTPGATAESQSALKRESAAPAPA